MSIGFINKSGTGCISKSGTGCISNIGSGTGCILLLNCFFYILSSCIPIVGMKYVQYKYNYNSFWFNIFLTISLCPMYFPFLIKRDVRQRLYKYKKKFYALDWGISHSCFEYEPFGYGIFEAVDWGKLPILHEKWHVPLDYKYKAYDTLSFRETYQKICEDDYETSKGEFEKLKNWMIKNFSNKDEWKQKLLDIYNGE